MTWYGVTVNGALVVVKVFFGSYIPSLFDFDLYLHSDFDYEIVKVVIGELIPV